MNQSRRTVVPLLEKTKGLVSALSSILRALARPRSSLPERISVNCVVGNFLMGDFLGAVKCRHGHAVRLFNIRRGHFVACDECRTYILVGSNLIGCWREETEAVWRDNSDSVEGYEFIEWDDG